MAANFISRPQFGKPIKLDTSKSEPKGKESAQTLIGANAMISQFLNMKHNYEKILKDATDGDKHAQRYFCEDDCAYIFSVNVMEALVNEIRKEGKDGDGCVVLFQGLRKEIVTPGNKHIFGRPTLIATAYKLGDDNNFYNIPVTEFKGFDDNGNPIITNNVEAFEHPGDGNGKTLKISLETDYKSPVVDSVDSSDSDIEFRIKSEIKEKDLIIGWTIKKDKNQ
jgi:hypothetical protein